VKVAYWPGCVSRGFTPELHGSMAKVAPLLDIELVELDRACCTGAGVIAEHNQELADTLNARTFALAQQEMANAMEIDRSEVVRLIGERAERHKGMVTEGRDTPSIMARNSCVSGKSSTPTRSWAINSHRASRCSTVCIALHAVDCMISPTCACMYRVMS